MIMSSREESKVSPLFITGTWRSGTTLLSRMFNNHPDIDVSYDTVHFLRFSFNKYNPISNADNAFQLIKNTSDRLKKRYQFDLEVREVLQSLEGQELTYSSIYDAIMRSLYLYKSKKTGWGEKTNLAWTMIPSFFEMYPQGKVLQIIRDPRAVLSSWKKFTNAPDTDYLDSILNSFDSMQKSIDYKEMFSDRRYLSIRYEDLVEDPENTLGTICSKFEIDYNESMLDISTFKDLYGDAWKSNSVHNKNLNSISTSAINKWQGELEDWEVFMCDMVMGGMLKDFNYEPFNVTRNNELINKSVEMSKKSELVMDGLVRFTLSKKGFERYPSDPLVESNWGKRKLKN